MRIDPFSQDLKLASPWAFITRTQVPEGWQFDQMILCHNTENLLRVAAEQRKRVTDGYLLRGAYIAAGIVEIPIHLHGFTQPR